MLTASGINKFLIDYMKSDDGKKEIERQTKETLVDMTDSQMQAIAEELSDMIIDAYLDEVKHSGKYFDRDTIRIGKPHVAAEGKTRVRITFDKKGLFRQSLVVGDGGYGYGNATSPYQFYDTNGLSYYATGPGVYDIIGLLTQGYSTKPVYGYWWNNKNNTEGDIRIKNKTSRAGSNFVTRAVNAFKVKYPYIDVKYPALWGGTK